MTLLKSFLSGLTWCRGYLWPTGGLFPILFALLVILEKRLIATRLSLNLLKVHFIFNVMRGITKHRIGFTSTRLSIHEYGSVNAVECAQDYFIATIFIHIYIIMILIEALIIGVHVPF